MKFSRCTLSFTIFTRRANGLRPPTTRAFIIHRRKILYNDMRSVVGEEIFFVSKLRKLLVA